MMKLEPIKAPEATARMNPFKLSVEVEEAESVGSEVNQDGSMTHFTVMAGEVEIMSSETSNI